MGNGEWGMGNWSFVIEWYWSSPPHLFTSSPLHPLTPSPLHPLTPSPATNFRLVPQLREKLYQLLGVVALNF
jgi:hypothetical protein